MGVLVVSFLDSNREERFYCGVLLHVLLTEGTSRDRVVDLVNRRAESALVPERVETYVEVAALRDAWRLLGDPKKWTAELQERRTSAIHRLLTAECGYERSLDELTGTMSSTAFFWSSDNPATRKVVSPGRWPIAQLDESRHVADPDKLKKLKWAFNAKPDLMLVDGTSGVLIEAKVVSGFGTAPAGYKQTETQDLIARLIPVVNADVCAAPLAVTTLTNHPSAGIRWQDVVEIVDRSEIGDFAYRALMRAASITS